jgi:drug/metabolite transporter (DMT)-like permease
MSDSSPIPAGNSVASGARLLVVLMGVAWGMNWVATRVILEHLSPWSLRVVGVGLGALVLFGAGAISRTPLSVPRGALRKLTIAAVFNVGIFNICSAYSQVYGSTSRAVVITYSMPIWTSLLAWLVLKETLTRVKLAALILCGLGLVILIGPLIEDGLPLGALFALACAWLWAVGTIYLKVAQIPVPTLTATAWQLLLGWLMIVAGMFVFHGLPQPGPLPTETLLWIGYNGLIGMGLIYFVWFVVVDKLPTMTASIGTLLVPVVGVIGATAISGERPNLTDTIGFALIFAAAATVLLQPNVRHDELPE